MKRLPVGRQAELADVSKLVETQRLVTVTGPAGVGKTRLALEICYRTREAFPGGIWLVELADARDFDHVLESTATAVDLREESGRDLAQQLADHLRHRHMLLVLDNCEHVIDEAAGLVARLLKTSRALHILTTSREPLRTEGESCVALTPLDFPDPNKEVEPDHLEAYPAIDLFCQRAKNADPGFNLGAGRGYAVARLCAELDGLPLALELAAARARTLAVDEMVERLEDRFALFSHGDRTAIPHHRTLEAAIAWSYELLDDKERTLFARLGVLAGFDLDAAEYVCSGGGLDVSEIPDTLARLVDKSLVRAEDSEQGRRYRLLETIRAYALARLDETDESSSVRRRHAEFYLSLANAFAEAAEASQVAS